MPPAPGNLAQTRVIWKEESTTEEMSPSGWPVWSCLWVAFSWLMIYMWGPSPLWCCYHWTGGPRYGRRKAEQVIGSRPIRNVPYGHMSQIPYQVLPWLPSGMNYYLEVWEEICPFLLKVPSSQQYERETEHCHWVLFLKLPYKTGGKQCLHYEKGKNWLGDLLLR